ncbi:hypothetical protein FRC10_007454 [Ceratobasidium sp. 414]|nr:hypothetical protein FRC10_007454 [Ceratobasidium sp. 414]
MSDQPHAHQRNAQPVRSIMPAVDNPVRKRERESETIESPDDASAGLPTPNGAGPSNGAPPAANGNGVQDPDKPLKPHKPLNRVPRACNACRKQKMRCEGADNPPCKRCRHAHIECMFEKPAREVSAATEQGLERIRSLETQVTSIQHTLSELVSTLRNQQPPHPAPLSNSAPSPSSATTASTQTPQIHPSPSPYSPSLNATGGYPAFHPPMALPPQMMQQHHSHHGHSHSHHGSEASDRDMAAATALAMAQRGHGHHTSQAQSRFPSGAYSDTENSNGMSLPPFSSLNNMAMPPPPGRQAQQGYSSCECSFEILAARSTSMPEQGQSPQRSGHQAGGGASGSKPTSSQHGSFHSDSGSYHSHAQQQSHQPQHQQHHQYHQQHHQQHLQYPSDHHTYPQQNLHPPHPLPPPPQHQRHSTVAPSSNVTSADSSDDEGELPTHGLVAPIEVLRGLAERQEREMGSHTRSVSPAASTPAPPSRSARSGPGQGHTGNGSNGKDLGEADNGRPTKRRKTKHAEQGAPDHAFPDVVTKGIIGEQEARELFAIFYRGCSTFLPVFDMVVDTFDALHARSPFCVNTICMVAASDTYQKCRAEVEEISRHTLFTPVARQEAVQAMVLVSGWSSNGWLPGGHAVRMGLEIGKCGGWMHKAWPRLFKRMRAGKMSVSQEERQLLISARTWFVLFLFEHQISFGTGRPAILREDESIAQCRMILQHPLSIQDDMRLVSMVELMVLREQIHNQLAPYEGPVEDRVYKVLHQAESDFRAWYEEWDQMFSQKYEDAAFYRQSLQIQRDFGELYHNATALRGVRGPEDVVRMPPEQKLVAQRAIKLARRGLENCIRSVTYREGLKYAVHFTHVTATFAASFLIRLARLFPQECDTSAIMSTVEDLVHLLSNIPAGRYARSLRLMLRSARRRRVLPPRPAGPVDRAGNPPVLFGTPPQGSYIDNNSPQQFMSASPGTHGDSSVSPHTAFNVMASNGAIGPGQEFDPYLQGFELAPGQEVPVWLSESSLGDAALSQFGLEAFVIPQQYDPNSTETQIW